VSRGLAVGDVDTDGDVDALVTNNNGPARLLLNQDEGDHWSTVRLSASGSNRWGFGARVGIFRKGRPTLWRRIGSDGSYLAARDPRAHFGLGDTSDVDRVTVEWPDGSRESWTSVRVDRELTLQRGTGTREAER
jgi:hypothetical protein